MNRRKMYQIFHYEFYNFIHSRGLMAVIAIAAVLTVVNIAISCSVHQAQFEGLQKVTVVYYYPLSIYNSYIGINFFSIATTILYLILPILVAIPYGASFCEMRTSGYLNVLYSKVSPTHHRFIKLLVGFFSGAIITIAIFTLNLVISAAFFPALTPIAASCSFPALNGRTILGQLYASYPLAYILFYIIYDAVFFGCISAFSVAISFVTTSKIMSWLLPGALFYGFSFFFEKMGLYFLSPSILVQQVSGYQIDIFNMIIVLGAVVVCYLVLLLYQIRREIQDVL